jgi:hypothetical protein
LWEGDLARGAQQQAAQREERQGEESGKNDLMHTGHYIRRKGVRANYGKIIIDGH